MWKIKLFLKGGIRHELKDVRSGRPGWAECQPSDIETLEFPFEGTHKGSKMPLTIVLSGMEKYNFFVEAMKAIGGNAIKINGIWFLGKLPNEDRVVGYRIGDTIKTINAPFGNEYNGFSTAGWKPGVVGIKPICKLI